MLVVRLLGLTGRSALLIAAVVPSICCSACAGCRVLRCLCLCLCVSACVRLFCVRLSDSHSHSHSHLSDPDSGSCCCCFWDYRFVLLLPPASSGSCLLIDSTVAPCLSTSQLSALNINFYPTTSVLFSPPPVSSLFPILLSAFRATHKTHLFIARCTAETVLDPPLFSFHPKSCCVRPPSAFSTSPLLTDCDTHTPTHPRTHTQSQTHTHRRGTRRLFTACQPPHWHLSSAPIASESGASRSWHDCT